MKIDWEELMKITNSFAIGTSCSLKQVPYSLENEDGLDKNLISILSFGKEKIEEIRLLKESLEEGEPTAELETFTASVIKANNELEGRVVREVR